MRVSEVTSGMTSTVSAPAVISVLEVSAVMNPPAVAILQMATIRGSAMVL